MTYSSSSLDDPEPAWGAYCPKDDAAWAPTVTSSVRDFVYRKLRRNFSRITAMLNHRVLARRNRSRPRNVPDVPDGAVSAGSSVVSVDTRRSEGSSAGRPTISRGSSTNTFKEGNRFVRPYRHKTDDTPTPSYCEDGYGDFTCLLPDSVWGTVAETPDTLLECSSLESVWQLDGSWASDDEDVVTNRGEELGNTDEGRSEEGRLVKRFIDLHDLTSVSVPRHCVRTSRLLLTGDTHTIYSGSMTTYHPQYSSYARSICIHTVQGLTSASDSIKSIKNVLVLRRLKHHHLLEVFGVCLEGLQDGGVMWILTSRTHFLVTLQRLLRWTSENNPQLLTRRCACTFARQICEALQYLETVGISHGNLTSSTIMLDGQCDVKLSGVGPHVVTACHYRWLAPESFGTDTVSPVWSFGVVMWEIESLGLLPYPHLNSRAEVFTYLVKGKRLIRPGRCTPQLYNIMKSCWSLSARRRLSISSLLSSLVSYHQTLPPSKLPHELFPDREHFWDVLQDYL